MLLVAQVVVRALTSDLAVFGDVLALTHAGQGCGNRSLRRLRRETMGLGLVKLLDSLVLLAREFLRHVHGTHRLLPAASLHKLTIVRYRHLLTLNVLENAHVVLLVS